MLRAAGGPNIAGYLLDAEIVPDERALTADQELLEAERRAALREAFAALPPSGRQLIALLTADPPVPYIEISARLGIPVGSIGPTRRRCLDKLRRHPAVAALINADTNAAADGDTTAAPSGSYQHPSVDAESALATHDHVIEATVIAMPHQRNGVTEASAVLRPEQAPAI